MKLRNLIPVAAAAMLVGAPAFAATTTHKVHTKTVKVAKETKPAKMKAR